MIRTVFADDEVSSCQKVRQLLEEIGGIDIVGEHATACETIDLVKLM
jgi:DNA-binding NarL/FixJ family response regulator